MTLNALLFDVDGTLADTERDGHRVAFNQTFRAFGLNWNWDVELYGKLLAVTGGKERIRYYVDNWIPEQKPEHFDELVLELHRDKTLRYNRILAEGQIPLRPGVARLIRQARESGLKLAVVTTTTPENVDALLKNSAADAGSWFDLIAAGDIVPLKKPAPDIYFWAMERLGLRASECLALEDSDNGYRAARAAQLKTVVTVNDYTRGQEFPGACAILSDLGEPGEPFHLLHGSAHEKQYVDIDLLRKWHQQ